MITNSNENEEKKALDDVLKRMLSTPPKPRVKQVEKKSKQSKKTVE